MPISICAAICAYNEDMGRGQQTASTGTTNIQSAVTRFDDVLGARRGSTRDLDSPLEGLSRQKAEKEKERLLTEFAAGRPEEAWRAITDAGEGSPSPHVEELRGELVAHCVKSTIRRWQGPIKLACEVIFLPRLSAEGKAVLHDQLEDILMTQIFDSSPSTQAEMDSLGNDEMVLALPVALAFSAQPHRREVVEGLFRGADLEVILRQAPPRERNLDRIIELMEVGDWDEALEKLPRDLPLAGDLDRSEKIDMRATCRAGIITQFYKALERQKLRNLDISTPGER